MSSGSTENLGLHLWEKTDLFQMDEFNEDNQLLDEAVAARTWVRLSSQTLSAESSSVTLDFTGTDLSAYAQLRIHVDAALSVTGRYPLYLMLNDVGGDGMYLFMNTGEGDSAFNLNEEDGLMLGYLAGGGSGTYSGMEITISLYTNGLRIESESLAAYGELTPVYTRCCGLPAFENEVSAGTLSSIRLYFEDTGPALAEGSTIAVYGILL